MPDFQKAVQSSLRFRLTTIVALFFFVALTGLLFVGRSQLRSTLETDARSNAEALLLDYLESRGTGSSARDLLDPDDLTRFAYFDKDGQEISEEDFRELIRSTAVQDFPEDVDVDAPVIEFYGSRGIRPDAIAVESFVVLPLRQLSDPKEVELGEEVIAVGAPVGVGDTEVTVAVSSPTQLIDDSVGAVTTFGLAFVPLLTALAALVTWIVVSRALVPVEAIRSHVANTDPTTLHRPVPETGTGDEIDRLAVTMNEMMDRLHEASVLQRQFISDASHELRSPITATLATIESMDDSNDWQRVSGIITNEQSRLASVVEDLLLLAHLDEKVSTGKQSAKPLDTEVDLDDLVLAERDRSRAVPVRVKIDEPVRLQGNPYLLQRCISNLVDNAARHATQAVEVNVGMHSEASNGQRVAKVTVDDDGPGVPADLRESIFERFHRLDAARNRFHGGAGLGLAIARDIASQHSGHLMCSDGPLGGARFTLTLELV